MRMTEGLEAVLTPEQMRAFERAAFANGVDPLLLMEDAARAMYGVLEPLMKERGCRRVLVACGPGNNGGDGAAMARLLLRDGYEPLLLAAGEPKTASARAMRAYYEALGGAVISWTERDCPEEREREIAGFRPDCVVDALFGTGFRGMPEGRYHRIIERINGLSSPVVFAVDIPSGMNGEDGSAAFDTDGGEPVCVRATHTACLGCWKPGLFLTRAAGCVGEPQLVPIALPEEAPRTELRMITPAAMRWIRPRPVDAHKGTAGRILMYMGSAGMAGAAAMAARAALRAGAGLVTVACPREIIPVLQALVPNAMCVPAETLSERVPPHDVLAAGCGLGRGTDTLQTLKMLLARETGTAVLDADALNLLAENPMDLPDKTVITPHPGEAARLMRASAQAVLEDPLGTARELAERYRAVALLKGHVSLASDGRQVLFQRRGGPALAKGGSGDALTGILAALCADRGIVTPGDARERLLYKAALASLWLGLAGERAQRAWGDRSSLTGEVVDLLPEVLAGGPV